jgi:hypothetical protein
MKDAELDFLTEEKSAMKQMFISEGNLMKNDLVVLQNEYKQTQMRHQEEILKLQEEMKRGDEQWGGRMCKLEEEWQGKAKKGEAEWDSQVQKLELDLLSVEK